MPLNLKAKISSPDENRLCSILNCPLSNEAVTTDVYQIPAKNNIRKKWLKVIEAHTTQTNLPQTAVVCYLHFSEDCFKTDAGNKKTLTANAVPSLFPKSQIGKGDFPIMKPTDFSNPKRGREFYEWSMKNYQEQKNMIQFLKNQATLRSKRIARLAKSIDDFKAKRFVSEDANNALQGLFDKIIDAQYDAI